MHPSTSWQTLMLNSGFWTGKAHRSCEEGEKGGKEGCQTCYPLTKSLLEGGKVKGKRGAEQPIKKSTDASLFNKQKR